MAGSWTDPTIKKGTFNGERFRYISATWTGDASDGSVPVLTVSSSLPNFSGLLLNCRVIFSGTATPTECDITVTDKDGIDLLGGAATSTNALTASGMVSLSPPQPFAEAMYVNIATAADNASDSATVVLYAIL